MNVESALAMIALASDGAPCEKHRRHDKRAGIDIRMLYETVDASSTDQRTRDALFMLLALVMELWRRNEYTYAALAPFLDQVESLDSGDRRRAAQIAAHGELLLEYEHQKPANWKGRALDSLALVHILLGFDELGLGEGTESHHKKALERLAGRDAIEAEKGAIRTKLQQIREEPDEDEEPGDHHEPADHGDEATGQ